MRRIATESTGAVAQCVVARGRHTRRVGVVEHWLDLGVLRRGRRPDVPESALRSVWAPSRLRERVAVLVLITQLHPDVSAHKFGWSGQPRGVAAHLGRLVGQRVPYTAFGVSMGKLALEAIRTAPEACESCAQLRLCTEGHRPISSALLAGKFVRSHLVLCGIFDHNFELACGRLAH